MKVFTKDPSKYCGITNGKVKQTKTQEKGDRTSQFDITWGSTKTISTKGRNSKWFFLIFLIHQWRSKLRSNLSRNRIEPIHWV